MSKHTFRKTKDYHIEWEDIDGQCHVHCKVNSWSKTVMMRGYLEFVKLREFIGEMGYEHFYSITPNPKFCELYCGEYIGEQNGKEVMIWETVKKSSKQ
jgi:hypothetical protein